MSINATRDRDIEEQNNTVLCERPQKRAARGRLVMPRWHGVRVIAERVRVPFGEDFHHPAIKIIDWMIHDWFKAAGVFALRFFYVFFESEGRHPVLAG